MDQITEVLFQIVFAPFLPCVAYPWIALLPASCFALIAALRWSRSTTRVRWGLALAAIAWLGYAIYEWRMFLWSQTVSNPIRVDMLFVAPIVYFFTIVGLIAAWRAFSSPSPRPSITP
jgi:hypothetical protein